MHAHLLPAGAEVGVAPPVPVDALSGPAASVAPALLNTILAVGHRRGRIVEVEAYGGADDPASHAHRGRNARNASMFARAGTLYCYLSHGIHTCANVVTGPSGEGQAVLVRALEPLAGLEEMRRARPGRVDGQLTDGPGKLCAALGIELAHDGSDLCAPGAPVMLLSDGTPPPVRPAVGPRVGISRALDVHWRFVVPGNPWVSRPRPAGWA